MRLVRQDVPFMNPCRLGLIPHSLHVCGTLLVPHTRLQMSCPSPSPGSEVRLAACSPRALQRTLVTGWASHRLMRHRGGTGSLSLPLPLAVAFPLRPAKAERAGEARGVWGELPRLGYRQSRGGARWGQFRAMRPQAPPLSPCSFAYPARTAAAWRVPARFHRRSRHRAEPRGLRGDGERASGERGRCCPQRVGITVS